MAAFDFAPYSHVAVEIPPEEAEIKSMNGWAFTAKPGIPYQPSFQLTISGMRWYLSGFDQLDVVTDPRHNAGRLLHFYREHRRWRTFEYPHEYLGILDCRFASAVQIPKALPGAGGLIPDFELTLIEHNPGY